MTHIDCDVESGPSAPVYSLCNLTPKRQEYMIYLLLSSGLFSEIYDRFLFEILFSNVFYVYLFCHRFSLSKVEKLRKSCQNGNGFSHAKQPTVCCDGHIATVSTSVH